MINSGPLHYRFTSTSHRNIYIYLHRIMDYIATNHELRNGDFLLSKDGNFKAIFQDDGNFVIYKWSPCWHTNTATNGGIRVLLQEDNNLVMYTKEKKPVWSSKSYNDTPSSKMRLTLTNEGHLVLDQDAQTVWSSEKSEGCKQ
ncbi:comitin [Gadus morhua]|uniref:Comitin-like n=1 Tax=Gadus morhua TaxID=8049 RepID=A0A8C5BTP2_GADMO|nr:comitin-like [Gadus morhua]